jgi:endoplasmic reticulum Man9GlcNAc2 1,2-alpha-mannosidase
MGSDLYHPISQNGSNVASDGGIGLTVVESLDTMLVMGLNHEVARARQWIAKEMSFERDGDFNMFETTTRMLGGLLSAYHLSGKDSLYLNKAIDLADRLMVAFDVTPTGLPTDMVNLGQRSGALDPNNQGLINIAEATTLQLEFRYLAEATRIQKYWERAENVRKFQQLLPARC